MVSQAHSVIGISSTLCFKPIQMGIPTVVLDGGNFIGSFENFIGFCKLNEVHEKIETQLKTGRDTSYIENILEGGVDYNSIEKYTSEIKRIVNG